MYIADDRSKVNFLESFPDADARLVLFEADLYDPDTFQFAIQGCEFVFHVATPFSHTEGSQVYFLLALSVFHMHISLYFTTIIIATMFLKIYI